MSEKIAFPTVASKPISELISLENRVIVVTGAARGIGQAIARRLHEAGATIVAVDRRTEQLEATAAELSNSKAQIIAVTADISQSAQAEIVAQKAISEFGRLDAWVNDAGVLPIKAALEVTDEEWQQAIDTNLTGTFYGCRTAGRLMKDQGGGVIINIASSLLPQRSRTAALCRLQVGSARIDSSTCQRMGQIRHPRSGSRAWFDGHTRS